MKLKVKKAFKWAHRHVDVQEYDVGQVIETEDQDLIRVATEEGWVSKGKEPKPDDQKEDPPIPTADADLIAAPQEAINSDHG